MKSELAVSVVEKNLKSIEAWECEVCGERFIDVPKSVALAHAQIVVPKKLPSGFVYSPRSGLYVIIDRNEPMIRSNHDLIQVGIQVREQSYRYYWGGDIHVKWGIADDYLLVSAREARNYKRIDDKKLKEVRRAFENEISMNRHDEIRGIKLKDLTNVLD